MRKLLLSQDGMTKPISNASFARLANELSGKPTVEAIKTKLAAERKVSVEKVARAYRDIAKRRKARLERMALAGEISETETMVGDEEERAEPVSGSAGKAPDTQAPAT